MGHNHSPFYLFLFYVLTLVENNAKKKKKEEELKNIFVLSYGRWNIMLGYFGKRQPVILCLKEIDTSKIHINDMGYI